MTKPVAKRQRKEQSRKQSEGERFRAAVEALSRIQQADWTDWELDWLESESRRPADYSYSETEMTKLNQLVHLSESFTHYAEYSVPELLKIASQYVADLDEDSQRFVMDVERQNSKELRRRQISRLAGICRISEHIPRDPLVDKPFH